MHSDPKVLEGVFSIVFFFFLEINTFIQQGCNK